MDESLNLSETASAGLVANASAHDALPLKGTFTVEHIRDGEVIFSEEFSNTITDVGKKLLLDTIFGNSAAGAVYMCLKGTGTAAAADTQASHAGWLEQGSTNAPTYTSPRKTPSWSSATGSGSVSKSTSAAQAFAITGTGTVYGCFINIGGTTAIDNTTGTLFSAGDFSSSRAVISGDTLNVTYTLSC